MLNLAFAIFNYSPFGGLQRDMLRLAESAVARGHSVTVFTHKWDGEKPENILVETLPRTARQNHWQAQDFERQFHAAVAAGNFSRTVAFNRIGGCDFYFAADNCLAAQLPRKRHALILRLLPRYRVFLAQEKKIFAPTATTKIFYITPQQKVDYQHRYATPESRFYYLPPGMNAACVRPQNSAIAAAIRQRKRAELGVAENEFLWLTVATNFMLKGGDRVLSALAALPPELAQRSQVFFAGVAANRKLQALAERLAAARRVTFLGGRNDVPELMLAADLLVHPAREEATGTVLVEAIAAGLPVLCSAECGFSNFVAEAAGFVGTSPWRQADFSAAVQDVLTNADEYRTRALAHAATVDFTQRARTAVEILESA